MLMKVYVEVENEREESKFIDLMDRNQISFYDATGLPEITNLKDLTLEDIKKVLEDEV